MQNHDQPGSSCAQPEMGACIDAHFAGRIGRRDERALRQHLPGCDSCTRCYERHLLLARLDPRASDARTRLARGIGIRIPRARWWVPFALPLAVAASIAIAFIFWPRGDLTPSEFTARGGKPQGRVELLIYRLQPGKPSARLGEEMSARDELAFAYRNQSRRKRLLVFGVDERRRVYWYHPAWTNERENPVAIPIAPVFRLPVGFVYDAEGRVVLDPDKQVQESVRLLFSTFSRTGAAHATVKYFRNQGLLFPTRVATGARKGEVTWGPLCLGRTCSALHNPWYAGAYAFGRARWRKQPDGKTGASACRKASGKC